MHWTTLASLGLLGCSLGLFACSDDSTVFTPSGSGGTGAAGGSGAAGGNPTGGAGGGGSCGDGATDAGEQCDDGNNLDGDGCSASCTLEMPPNCGDGVLDPPLEECDDGNNAAGDGCDAACQLEPVGQMCGNTLDAGEKCDDGNLSNGDGCNPTCNFLTQVTELALNVPGMIIASDGSYLYAYGGPNSNCQIHRTLIAPCIANPGTCQFAPFVGAGGCGAPSDGPGASAVLAGGGAGLAFGAGKLFFADNHTVRAVDLQSASFDVTTLAGDPTLCGQQDGMGNQVVMSDVRGMTFYNGLLYFVDANMATLRSLDPVSTQVTTLAGVAANDNSGANFNCATNLCCGNPAMAADGVGTAGVMNSPRYITGDNSGGLYIIDSNGSAIRHYDVASNYLGTVISGVGYSDGVGAAVLMDRPRGITSDGTSLYFGEQDENTIRQVELSSATTSTFVGVRGCAGPANLNGQQGGDGSQDWSGQCNNAAVANKPQFPTGITTMAFDFATSSIYAIASGNRLLRIE